MSNIDKKNILYLGLICFFSFIFIYVAIGFVIFLLLLKISKINWKLILITVLDKISFALIILYSWYLYLKGTEASTEAYYYTLSTISQSIAALVAFEAMFLFYRLEILENKKQYLYEKLKNRTKSASQEPHLNYEHVPPYYDDLYKLEYLDRERLFEKLSSLLIEMDKVRQFIPSDSNLKNLIKDYQEIKKEIDEINKQKYEKKILIKNPIIFSGATIFSSIFFLATGQIWLSKREQLFILGLVVALSAYTILGIVKSLTKLLWSDK